ncbi:MAG: hypothetical protein JWO40_281 [Candidatus Doudnabacteria bacterium]|nr:hypothetical protein [Candidatus Doudnabacteria bacterium]
MIIGLVLSFIFGSIIGSFLNVLILRLPVEKTLNGRSHCMQCKHQLNALDLVPILSFVFLRGKCRYCKKPFSHRYFYIEVITGLLFALCFAKLFPINSLEYLILLKSFFISAVLMVVFMIDYEHFLILDKVVIFASVVLILFNLAIDIALHSLWFNSLTLNGLLAALGLFLFFGGLYYISKGRWIGFGDVKFSFVLGLATVFPIIVINILLAFMIGSVVGLVLMASKTKKLQSEIPFGTFLAISCMITVLYGSELINWYLRLIGVRIYV